MFETTHWSLVKAAQADSVSALQTLFTAYRPAMLAYLVHSRGVPEPDGEDLVQGFCEQMLRRGALASADQTRGRFRTFLRVSLRNFAHDQQRAARAARRGGGLEPCSLDAGVADTEDGPGLAELPGRETPADVAYDRAWVKSVMGRALQRLEAECAPRRLLPLLKALEPILYRDPGHPGYAELAAGLGSSEGALKVAAHRLRNRLRTLIREEVAQTVASPEDLEEELKHLLRAFDA